MSALWEIPHTFQLDLNHIWGDLDEFLFSFPWRVKGTFPILHLLPLSFFGGVDFGARGSGV